MALVAIAVAIYEVGKAFGWWKDVGTMLEAIKNNIGRIMGCFINHPDVKATIKAIQDAWSDLNEISQTSCRLVEKEYGMKYSQKVQKVKLMEQEQLSMQ